MAECMSALQACSSASLRIGAMQTLINSSKSPRPLSHQVTSFSYQPCFQAPLSSGCRNASQRATADCSPFSNIRGTQTRVGSVPSVFHSSFLRGGKLRIGTTKAGCAARRWENRCFGAVRSSLGFSSEPRIEVEKAAGNLLKDAASVLIYQSVLTAPPAQAMLKLLLALRRSDDQVRILESYGIFFNMLAKGGHSSWEEYVLDRILAGEDNAFATAAAKGQTVNGKLLAAAASDLDVLQGLAIMERSLVSWVGDVVGLRPAWKVATAGTAELTRSDPRPPPAESRFNFGFALATDSDRTSTSGKGKRQSEKEDRGPGSRGFGFNDEASENRDRGSGGFGFGVGPEKEKKGSTGFGIGSEPSTSGSENESDGRGRERSRTDDNGKIYNEGMIGLAAGGGEDPTSAAVATNAEWRARISGLWKWSEAVPLLESYYRKYGTGVVASNLSLKWQAGKLVACAPVKEVGAVLNLQQIVFDAIVQNVRRHAEGRPAHHVLLHGRSGMGKSWVLAHAAAYAAKASGVRTVLVSRQEVKTLDKLLEEIRTHPNVRFAILLDDLSFKTGEEGGVAFKQLLEGSYEEWPSNAIVLATSPTRELTRGATTEAAQREGGSVGQHFGLALELPKFEKESFSDARLKLSGRPDIDGVDFDESKNPSVLTVINLIKSRA